MTDPREAPEPPRVRGRAGRGRIAPVAGGLRALQQAVLRSFAATGTPPSAELLAKAAAPFGVTAPEVVAELARQDFLVLDEAGQICGAYPFSAVATPHRVRIGGRVEVHAMCAIDALGIPPMLAADAVITSADPMSGAPVIIAVTGGRAVWEPPGAVVFSAVRAGGGPAAEVSCGYVNFFTSADTARAWAGTHPGVAGRLLGQGEAQEIGRDVFGSVMAG